MIVKIETWIYLDVTGEDQAEEACSAFSTMLDGVITQSGFPHGEVIECDVDHYEKVSDEEIKERGLEE